MELKINKRSNITNRPKLREQRVEWGTSLRPGPTFTWDKDESKEQAMQILITRLFKGRVKNIRHYRERPLALMLDSGEVVTYHDEILEVSSASYILAIRDITGCHYKYKVHVTDLRTGRIYNFIVKNGVIYHKGLGIGNQVGVIANFILTEPSVVANIQK